MLKSIFISSYMALIATYTVVALWLGTLSGRWLAWAGVLLTTIPMMLVIARLLIFKNIVRTSARFPLVNVLGIVGTALSLVAWLRSGGGPLAATIAFSSWIGFLAYAYWFSSFQRGPSALIVGSMLPAFTVTDVDGRLISAPDFVGRPTVLVFYRGNWCPLCMAQIKELAKSYIELAELGVRVALISPQTDKNTKKLARTYGVAFDYYTDAKNSAAQRLGIENVGGTPLGMQLFGYDSDTVLPTVIVVDAGGTIVWAHETDNYRVRPEPEVFLAVLRQTKVLPHRQVVRNVTIDVT